MSTSTRQTARATQLDPGSWLVVVKAANREASAVVEAYGDEPEAEHDYGVLGMSFVRLDGWQTVEPGEFECTVAAMPALTCPSWCSSHSEHDGLLVLRRSNGEGLDGELVHERELCSTGSADVSPVATVYLVQVDQLHEGQFFPGTPRASVSLDPAAHLTAVDLEQLSAAAHAAAVLVDAAANAEAGPMTMLRASDG